MGSTFRGTDQRLTRSALLTCKLARLGGAQRFSHLLMQRDGIERDWSCFMAEHNLVLTPTSARLPFPHGFDVASKEGAAATKIKLNLSTATVKHHVHGVLSKLKVCTGDAEILGIAMEAFGSVPYPRFSVS